MRTQQTKILSIFRKRKIGPETTMVLFYSYYTDIHVCMYEVLKQTHGLVFIGAYVRCMCVEYWYRLAKHFLSKIEISLALCLERKRCGALRFCIKPFHLEISKYREHTVGTITSKWGCHSVRACIHTQQKGIVPVHSCATFSVLLSNIERTLMLTSQRSTPL